MANLNKILKETNYMHKECFDDERNCSVYRWNKKKVLSKKTVYKGDTLDNLVITDCLNREISNDVYLTGHSSAHFWIMNHVENVKPRPWPGIHLQLNGFNAEKYNRLSLDIYIDATGYQGFYYQFGASNENIHSDHCEYLLANKWNHVIFELDNNRNNLKEIIISPWVTGTPPEGEEPYHIYLDNITFEEVEVDNVNGWDANYISYSQLGYLLNKEKIALISLNKGDTFKLFKGKSLYKEYKVSFDGSHYILDFSDCNEVGSYHLEYGDLKTKDFLISDNCYDEAIWKSMNFLRLLRCGVDIEGVHSACHLNCKTVHPITKATVPNFGGWHDAGDVSQFEIPTAEMANAIIDLAYVVKDKDHNLYERLKEEARVGLHWLLQTRFGDGYRALTVTYGIWRSNILYPDNETVYTNQAEAGPFENFLSACALGDAYNLYKDSDKVFASWCMRAAIEDYNFAVDEYKNGIYCKRWGPSIVSVTSGQGIYASIILYNLTKDKKYLDQAVLYAKDVMDCQQTSYIGDINPIRGFFYEDKEHQYVLTYEHRGHEQSVIQGMVELCKVYKDHEDYNKWLECINMYAEYIKISMKFSNKFGLLPGHIYIVDKLNIDRFTIPSSYGTKEEGLENLITQIKHGVKMGEGIYLRMLPIAVQRRGYHATLLSKTKGVSAIAKFLNDKELMQMCINQIEWVLGKNPFASSTMYGCGNNYHPLYTAFSRQMVGALPVGIMTKDYEDLPYWPVRDGAVYKEIWGHTTGKFLWVLCDILD